MKKEGDSLGAMSVSRKLAQGRPRLSYGHKLSYSYYMCAVTPYDTLKVTNALVTSLYHVTKWNVLCLFHNVICENLVYVPPLLRLESPVFSHTMYLCVSYGYQNKYRLFPFAGLFDWSLQWRLCLLEVRVESLYKMLTNIRLLTTFRHRASSI